MSKIEHPLSWNAIGRIVATIFGIYLAWILYRTLLMIFVSIMLAAAFYPLVFKLQKKLTLPLASILVVFSLLIPIIIILFTIVPGIIVQFPEILRTLDQVVTQSSIIPPAIKNIDLSQYSQNAGTYILRSTSQITGYLTAFFTVMFLTLYFLIDSKRLNEIILSLIPDEHKEKAQKLAEDLTRINGQYIRGNLIISLVCGISTFIGLSAIGVPYAPALALFAGLVDLLPQIGAVIGATPAVILAFTVSPTHGLATLALFIVYQQIENNVLSPNVYNKALDLSPALSFIAVLIGGSLAGIVGAFIALPIAASIPTIVKYIQSHE